MPANPQNVSVLTQHNDNTRAGWNDHETALTTGNVNTAQFGALFHLSVDDQVYAQPLVVGGVSIGNGTHNVVYVATVNNTVYAYDGDNGTLYWQKNYTVTGMRPPRNTDMTLCGGGYVDFSGNIGIVSTPVIDPATSRMYFVARSTDGASYQYHLHAVSIVDGTEAAGSPMQITAIASGNGDGSVANVITFDAHRQNQRQGLALVNGMVYLAFSSHGDCGPYHGWILGYDATTLQQQVVYNDTPNGGLGGMWESGMGLAADGAGNLYAVTGNGTVGANGDPTDPVNRAESALKLTRSGGGSTLTVASYFTPHDWSYLNTHDLDYGGNGALLIPNTNFFLTGAKNGKLYLVDKDAMGGFDSTTDNVQQVLSLTSSEQHHQPAYYHGATGEWVYIWPENEPLRAIPFNRATGQLSHSWAVANAPGPSGHSGAMITVSSNASQDSTAIVWASYPTSGDAEHQVSPGILRAFAATDITHQLWNNQLKVEDASGTYAKFASPTVANGHVYLPTFSNQVVVYGLK